MSNHRHGVSASGAFQVATRLVESRPVLAQGRLGTLGGELGVLELGLARDAAFAQDAEALVREFIAKSHEFMMGYTHTPWLRWAALRGTGEEKQDTLPALAGKRASGSFRRTSGNTLPGYHDSAGHSRERRSIEHTMLCKHRWRLNEGLRPQAGQQSSKVCEP